MIEGLLGRLERGFGTRHEEARGGGMGWDNGVKSESSDDTKSRGAEERGRSRGWNRNQVVWLGV